MRAIDPSIPGGWVRTEVPELHEPRLRTMVGDILSALDHLPSGPSAWRTRMEAKEMNAVWLCVRDSWLAAYGK